MKSKRISLAAASALVLLMGIGATVYIKCAPGRGPGKSTLTVSNKTAADTKVFFAFGSDSVVLPSSWAFCTPSSNLTCSFELKASDTRSLPLAGNYLNATFAFGGPVACGSTKGELNVNNPKWYDIADVSLVDGYSNNIAITINGGGGDAGGDGGATLGPPNGSTGNEKVFGLFPLGCDICTARQSPPCGILPGGTGCKAGTQYKPDVPCQFQGTVMGGGSAIEVDYLGVTGEGKGKP